MNANCKHCNNEFEQRRSNHLYCKPGCKTMASYKRNGYTYVSGSYRKNDETGLSIVQKDNFNIKPNGTKKIEKKLKGFDKKFNQLENLIEKGQKSSTSLLNSILGPLIATTGVSFGKKIFWPGSLPATRDDVNVLKKENYEIKKQNIEIQEQNKKLLKHFDLIEQMNSLI